MSRENTEYIQCTHCGQIYKEKIQYREDDLYICVKCKHCGKVVKHLRCGYDYFDISIYYDPVLDERYYDYNTK